MVQELPTQEPAVDGACGIDELPTADGQRPRHASAAGPVARSFRRAAWLVLWGGESRAARHGKLAGQLMLDFAGTIVCRAEAFSLGRPAPVLAIDDRLAAGGTYLVLPVERLP